MKNATGDFEKIEKELKSKLTAKADDAFSFMTANLEVLDGNIVTSEPEPIPSPVAVNTGETDGSTAVPLGSPANDMNIQQPVNPEPAENPENRVSEFNPETLQDQLPSFPENKPEDKPENIPSSEPTMSDATPMPVGVNAPVPGAPTTSSEDEKDEVTEKKLNESVEKFAKLFEGDKPMKKQAEAKEIVKVLNIQESKEIIKMIKEGGEPKAFNYAFKKYGTVQKESKRFYTDDIEADLHTEASDTMVKIGNSYMIYNESEVVLLKDYVKEDKITDRTMKMMYYATPKASTENTIEDMHNMKEQAESKKFPKKSGKFESALKDAVKKALLEK